MVIDKIMNTPTSSRYERVVQTISYKEAINLIELKYKSKFDPFTNLDVWDQLLICESLQESTPINFITNESNTKTNVNGNVNGSVNDTRRRKVNFELSQSKLEVISKLKQCNYRTSPFEISGYLEIIFSDYSSQEGHWLYIAQTWPPRPINRVIDRMLKQQKKGLVTIKNPPAYFTNLLRYRKKRRIK